MCLIVQNYFVWTFFLIKTTHFRESQLSLWFGTTINFVGVNNSGRGKVGIVRAAVHLGVPG